MNRSKTIPLSPGEWSFFVSGDWSPFVLVNSSQCTLDANVGYNIRVTGVETHSNIVSPSHLKWTRIITTKRCSLHINSESIQSGLQVHLYRSGILWRSEEHASEHSLSLSFNVISQDSGMDSGMDSEFSWIPSFPDLMSTESANSFAYHLLRTMHIEAMSKSSIVNTMLQRCLPWRYMLSTRWIPTQHDIVSEIIELLNRKRMSDGFVKLIHSAVLMCRVDRDFSFDAVGLSLMQRIRHQKWRHSEHPRENTMSELSVIGFGVMQLQYSEFSRCYKLGVFQGVDNISEYGFVADGENGRLLVVPKDVNQLQIVMAISSLFPCDNPIEEEEILFLPFDTIHSEVSYSGCVHTMKMSPYRLSLSLDGITLTWDADTKCQTADKCISVDELQTGTIPIDSDRIRRGVIVRMFPSLAKRVDSQLDPVTACFVEVQSRRLCFEWSLEGIDIGNNLSSLGMSILFSLLLGHWIGARVRVFIGKGGCALVGYWSNDRREFILVDPTATERNWFDVETIPNDSVKRAELKKGSFIEVLSYSKWHIGRVERIDRYIQSAEVWMIKSERKKWVSMPSRKWRHISDEDGDTQQTIARLLRNSKV